MRRIFRVIRKKRNLRRLRAACFLLLIFIEVFSHAQNDGQIFADAPSSPSGMKISTLNRSDETHSQTTITISDNEGSGSHQPICQDEISHHQGLLTGFSYSFDTASFASERIAFRRSEFVHNSLPPPYLPPKFS